MRHHLNGLAQVVAVALAVYNRFIDTPCGDAVVAGGVNARKALVVSQIQVCLETVLRYVAFAVLVRVQGSRVNVDIRVELLDGDLVAACLQQFAYAGRNYALTK